MPDTLENRHLTIAVAGCTFFALALYAFTLAPTFGWGDSADLAMRMVTDSDPTFVGRGRDYPLYRWVGGFFQHLPFGDAGTRANAMAAFFGAMTVGLVAFISGTIARSVYAAWAAGIALAVSHTFWLMSVLAEVYSFNAALIFAAYALMVVWWRTDCKCYPIIAAFFVGLALNHHATGMVVAATIAPLFLLRIGRWPIAWIALGALMLFSVSYPYWLHSYQRFSDGFPFLQALGLKSPNNVNYTVSPWHEWLKFIAYAAYNFIGAALPLAVLGLVVIWRTRRLEMLPTILWFLLITGAGIASSIPDKFNIYVLVYPVVAIAVGIGAAWLRERRAIGNRLMLLLLVSLALVPPLAYVTAVQVVKRLNIDLVGARVLPYRDNDWYFMVPWKRGDFGPRRYAEGAFREVDANAMLIADYSVWRPLYLLQAVEAVRPDVKLVWTERIMWLGTVAQYIAKQPCNQPIYLATDTPENYYQLNDIRAHYTVTKLGIVSRVERTCHR